LLKVFKENGVCLFFVTCFFFSLSVCREEQVADNEPTVARLYGEELRKIKVFELADSETKKTHLPAPHTTEQRHFNLNLDSNVPAAASNFCVEAEDEERVGSVQVPTEVEPVNAAPDCLDILMGKQSSQMGNDDEIDGVIAASSKMLPKLSHTECSLVSLQQQKRVTCLIIQLRR
jgi:hypothetical protein